MKYELYVAYIKNHPYKNPLYIGIGIKGRNRHIHEKTHNHFINGLRRLGFNNFETHILLRSNNRDLLNAFEKFLIYCTEPPANYDYKNLGEETAEHLFKLGIEEDTLQGIRRSIDYSYFINEKPNQVPINDQVLQYFPYFKD